VFLVNSRNPRFSATPSRSGSKSHHDRRHTFFRSYGVILPSSLARVLPRALGYSPRLPESVCGTVTSVQLARLFLEAWDNSVLGHTATSSPLEVEWRLVCPFRVLRHPSTGLSRLNNPPARAYPSPSPLKLAHRGGTGILACCPSSTPFGLDLGTD
jgi:hypothetical protein